MNTPSEPPLQSARDKLIGFGERSVHKSYYPELKNRVEELERFRALLDQAGDLIFMLSVPEAMILDANLRARSVFELGPEHKLRACGFFDLLDSGHSVEVTRHFDSPAEHEPFEVELLLPGGGKLECELSLRLVSLSGQDFAVAVARDITRRKEFERKLVTSLREKEVMLREIHHRVKNNLQVISSLLSLQAMTLSDPQAVRGMNECRSRIKSMSLVHEKLYGANELSRVNMAEYLNDIKSHLFSLHNHDKLELCYEKATEEVYLSIDKALPCGLIYNELLSNALCHAFRGRDKGLLETGLCLRGGQVWLTLRDDGVGLPESLNLDHPGTLGLNLVKALCSQLSGKLECPRQSVGTCFSLSFTP